MNISDKLIKKLSFNESNKSYFSNKIKKDISNVITEVNQLQDQLDLLYTTNSIGPNLSEEEKLNRAKSLLKLFNWKLDRVNKYSKILDKNIIKELK